ncbi:unnamed protein product [Ectocarpus sp. 13 AM-2016]
MIQKLLYHLCARRALNQTSLPLGKKHTVGGAEEKGLFQRFLLLRGSRSGKHKKQCRKDLPTTPRPHGVSVAHEHDHTSMCKVNTCLLGIIFVSRTTSDAEGIYPCKM